MKKKKNNKINEIVMIIIEYLWLAMAAFTAVAGIMKFNEGGYAEIFAWVFIVLSIMCIIMFFVRRSARKQRRRKQN